MKTTTTVDQVLRANKICRTEFVAAKITPELLEKIEEKCLKKKTTKSAVINILLDLWVKNKV